MNRIDRVAAAIFRRVEASNPASPTHLGTDLRTAWFTMTWADQNKYLKMARAAVDEWEQNDE